MDNTLKLIKCPLKSEMKMGKYCLTLVVNCSKCQNSHRGAPVPKNHEGCFFVPIGSGFWSQARELESVAWSVVWLAQTDRVSTVC